MAKRKLFAVGGRVNVRETRAGTDGATWTPDNLAAGEISGGVLADHVTLDSDDWEDVYLVAQFAGTPTGSEVVTIQPLRAVWKAAAPGRDWVPFGSAIALTAPANGKSALLTVNQAKIAFRITALTLDGATSVTLLVTSGQRAPKG